LPLHVITADSGEANKKVSQAVDAVCDGLTRRGFVVKQTCTDGDPRYNAAHKTFFAEWYPILIEGELSASLQYMSGQTKLPDEDFLHTWKWLCNRVKKQTMTMNPLN
jgi:hypothetical protein